MKPTASKMEFIKLRAGGCSLRSISETLHMSKTTCLKWDKKFKDEIARYKADELNDLYQAYQMTRAAKIKQIGNILHKLDAALEEADLTTLPPEKLLDYKLKYMAALGREYIGTASTSRSTSTEDMDAKGIVAAYAELLERVRIGDVPEEQADRESAVLASLLKAYDTAEVKARLDELEVIVEQQRQHNA